MLCVLWDGCGSLTCPMQMHDVQQPGTVHLATTVKSESRSQELRIRMLDVTPCLQVRMRFNSTNKMPAEKHHTV